MGKKPLCSCGIIAYYCVTCKGDGICFDPEHNKDLDADYCRKERCPGCKGGSLCPHDENNKRKLKQSCSICSPNAFCNHGPNESLMRKTRCILCKGGSICPCGCGKPKWNCINNDGKSRYCEHIHNGKRRFKRYCPICSPCKCGNGTIDQCKFCKPNEYLIYLLRQSIKKKMKNYNNLKNKKHTMEYIGCSPEELRKHFENLFKVGMSWENQGEWHIDHIRPCAYFNLNNEDERKACFHYTNLQPMWGSENMSKQDKYNVNDDECFWNGNKWVDLC